MFKKWLDLDVKAYRAARLNAVENLKANEGSYNHSALEEIIAGLIESVKPGPGKSGTALIQRRWFTQSPGAI
jgi:hypothetical protein